MSTAFDFSALDPENPVASAQHPQLVGCQDSALILEETENGVVENVAPNMGVYSAQWIIHQDDVGIKADSPGDVQALLLPAGDGNPTLANLGEVAVGKHIQIRLQGASI